MTQQWTMPAWLVLATAAALVATALLAIAALVARRRGRAVLSAESRAARAECAELRSRVESLEQALSAPVPDAGYLITRLGDEPEQAPGAAVEAPLFADQVLRESVLHAAGLVHGLRRALSPETQARIRFEMRREVKRSRKQRRADLRAARRDDTARERAAA